MAKQLDPFFWKNWRHRFTSVETYWNHSIVCGVLLCVLALSFAVFANVHNFLPGVSIAVLGLMAAVVSLRPYMHIAEKAAWCSIFAAVLFAEIRAIRKDRKQTNEAQSAIRDEQNAQFARVAKELRDAVSKSQAQYTDTVQHVDNVLTKTNDVLSTTQKVAGTAQENLTNVTGGESYAYVWPTVRIGDSAAVLNIHNFGKQALSITVTIYEGATSFETASVPSLSRSYGALYIGPVAPGEGRVIPPPRGDVEPHLGADGVAHYQIYINQQNTGVNERLDFRPALAGNGWAYKLKVVRAATGRHRKSDVLIDGQWKRYLKITNWIEPGLTPNKPY